MAITLREALTETTKDWKKALPEPWRAVFRGVELDADAIPLWLKHLPWVPIFPVFRNQATREIFQAYPIPPRGTNLIGIANHSHTFRALLTEPEKVKVVIVGQDPYPDITDATGQSFEQGSIKNWINDAEDVAGSLKPILQTAAASAHGDDSYRVRWEGWDKLVDDIIAGKIEVASPSRLFPAYQKQGLLWMNTTLTISHFRVYPRGKPDRTTKKPPGYQEAHAAYWKPFVSRLFEYIVSRGVDKPVIFGLFGGWAKAFKPEIEAAALAAGNRDAVRFVEAGHPVTRNFIERSMNPFDEINDALASLGQRPVNWLPKR